MDQFISKLNLQNLLRQFCCGVVLFVPLYLFAPCQMRHFWYHTGLSDARLICVAVLAFIIGTIIYHLEKNLYSYLIQAIFESVGACFLRLVFFIIIIGNIGLWIIGWNWSVLIGVLLVMLTIAALCCIALPIFSKDFNSEECDDETDRMFCRIVQRLIVRTEQCWEIENEAEGVSKRQFAIASRVSVWSDFVHCVQSCCFAWILGTIIAYYLHPCHTCGCSGDCCVYIQHMCMSVVVAIFILLVEIGIDAHRYIHVKRMTTLPEYRICRNLCPKISMSCRRCCIQKECFIRMKGSKIHNSSVNK